MTWFGGIAGSRKVDRRSTGIGEVLYLILFHFSYLTSGYLTSKFDEMKIRALFGSERYSAYYWMSSMSNSGTFRLSGTASTMLFSSKWCMMDDIVTASS